uniref:Uncharacterized protein n=1 Tax=Plesiomonas shigelloides TaxID=703 RepID=A0A481WFP7_PLESH|nr:hypothetical protein [Plesiomonas shigelloides]
MFWLADAGGDDFPSGIELAQPLNVSAANKQKIAFIVTPQYIF